jgi:hypothetical protein
MKNSEITQAALKEKIHYDPETGIFRWLVNRTNGVKAGDLAATSRQNGYAVMCFANKTYKAHRLAWLYMTGEFPPEYIDHINCEKSDNRWSNLRMASNSENQRNRTGTGSNCGAKNVTFLPKRNKFQVSLKVAGKEKFIGYYDDFELADLVAHEAREKFHGTFARHR